jgi:dipeptidyl aminopeptidase/acylaminoacyl peptidase
LLGEKLLRKLIPILVLVFGCACPVRAQKPIEPACLSNENLRHYRLPGSPQLSPDGRRVVFAIRESAAEKGASHLWWAEADKPESARQITFSSAPDSAGESDPQWMPDGSAILFLAKRDKHRQVYRLPADGGEAEAVKIEYPPAKAAANARAKAEASESESSKGSGEGDRAVDVSRYEISPNGKWLALVAKDQETAEEKKKKADKNDAVEVDQEPHNARVWLYSFAGGSLAPVTGEKVEAISAEWSRDSQQLAVVTRPPGNSDDLGPKHSVAVIEVADPESSRAVTGIPPSVFGVSWSPNDETFAFTAQTSHDAPPGVNDLYVIPVAGGKARDLTEASGVEIARGIPEWSKDGSGIFMEIQQGTFVRLGRLPANGGAPEYFDTGSPYSGSFATNLNQSGWTFIAQSTARPPEVMFIRDVASHAAPIRLSRVNPLWPDTGWVRAQPAEWAGRDGLKIHGLLFLPPARGCQGKKLPDHFPMIVNVHGGPTGAFLESFSPFNQLLLAQGWAVLEPNPRGSTGYGWQFTAANKNDLGGKDYEDIMAGLDWALAHYPVDSRRLGLYGYSYGGEMAGFVEGRTARFAAIISGAPVIDQYSEYGTEDGSWYDRWFFGQPWVRPEDAWKQSPLARAGDAKTPFLLLQGESDQTDPLGQSQEMYRALRQAGVPVEMVQFPRESHGGLATGIFGYPSREPWHGFDARQHILDWFNSHFPKE